MRNNRRAGKPAGKKPDKTGLLGLFTKGKDIPTTAQQTLPYREMYRDGVCRVEDRYYTKTIEYEDINYQLAQTEDQAAIFDGWSACLNYFDSSLPFQLSFLNHRSRPGSRYSVNIPMQEDDYNSVRREYVEMLENCALPGFVDSKNEEKTERNAGYLVVSHSGGGMLRQGTRKGIRRTPANRGMRAHRIVKSLDISEDVCHGMCP
mgnify:CR=1 FL=1